MGCVAFTTELVVGRVLDTLSDIGGARVCCSVLMLIIGGAENDDLVTFYI